jgi:DNA repair protein RecO (recombination protein O)
MHQNLCLHTVCQRGRYTTDMRSAKTTRTEAVVLKAMNYGETDKILTLYTPTLGKARGIAKGVRRVTSRMGGHLDLFTHSSVLMVHGRNMEIVTQGQAIHAFPRLRDDLEPLGRACYVVELTDRFTEDAEPNPELFRSLVQALIRIDAGTAPELTLCLFQLQLLALSGYRPQLHRCVTCDALIAPGANAFDPALGGVLCPACAPAQRTALPISDTALKLLRNLQTRGEAMLSVRAPQTAIKEAENALALYVQQLLERRPRSAAFLDALHRVETA